VASTLDLGAISRFFVVACWLGALAAPARRSSLAHQAFCD
jgi:hypothetical protein